MLRANIPLVLAVSLWLAGPAPAAADITLSATDLAGKPVASIVDGNTVRLHAALSAPASRSTDIVFRLDTVEEAIAACTIPRGARACDTFELRTLGWYWDDRGEPRPSRVLSAALSAQSSAHSAQSSAQSSAQFAPELAPKSALEAQRASLPIRIAPRSIVLVHGFMSDHRNWAAYAAPGGLLAPLGLKGGIHAGVHRPYRRGRHH